MAYLVFVGVLTATLVTFTASSFVEPQCTCSKFHYEEQLLEKMIRTEVKYEELQKSVEKVIADMKQKYAAFVDITREQQDAYEGKIDKSVAEHTNNVMTNLTAFMDNTSKQQHASQRNIDKSVADMEQKYAAFVDSTSKQMHASQGKIDKSVAEHTDMMTNVTEVLSAFKLVAFRGKRLADRTLQTNQTFVFQDTLFNYGSGYDNTTGIFTAPVAGIYQFDAHICLNSGKTFYYAFVVDGVEQTVGEMYSQSYDCETFDMLVDLKLGARVWIWAKYNGIQMKEDSARMNYFSGFLVR